jgi:hypothetical protein
MSFIVIHTAQIRFIGLKKFFILITPTPKSYRIGSQQRCRSADLWNVASSYQFGDIMTFLAVGDQMYSVGQLTSEMWRAPCCQGVTDYLILGYQDRFGSANKRCARVKRRLSPIKYLYLLYTSEVTIKLLQGLCIKRTINWSLSVDDLIIIINLSCYEIFKLHNLRYFGAFDNN